MEMNYDGLQTPWCGIVQQNFLFLHGIGKDRLQDYYKVESLKVLINKNKKHSPHHARSFAAIKYVVSFLNNYTEENAISLSGRIPGYKRDNIKLLPSNRSKVVRHLLAYTVKITSKLQKIWDYYIEQRRKKIFEVRGAEGVYGLRRRGAPMYMIHNQCFVLLTS